MQDSDDNNEHQQQSPPRPKTSKKLTGAATYRTKFSSIWVSHYRVLFEVERSAISTVLRAVTGDCDPVYGGCRCGLPYYSIYYHAVTVDFCDGHRVTAAV